jgi:hypothetical protein
MFEHEKLRRLAIQQQMLVELARPGEVHPAYSVQRMRIER